MDKKELGRVGELRVSSSLIEHEYTVHEPVTEERYDLLALKNDMVRVQCKVAYQDQDNSGYRARFETSNPNHQGKQTVKKYDGTQVDAFAIYNPDTEDVYWLWFEEAPSSGARRSLDTWERDLIGKKLK